MYDEITLSNGLRIIGERIDHFRSVSVGVWLGAGSQYETQAENGLSHFLEHMLFKGTEKRTARQIAEEMDRVGAMMNAFTSKDCTCYYTKAIDEHIELCVDMLSDLVINASLDPAELEKEKGVIIEEIGMTEDAPEDIVHELLARASFGDDPLARTILGPADNIRRFTRDDMAAYRAHMYTPGRTVLALAGHYDWAQVCELAEKYFGGWKSTFDVAPLSPAPFKTGMERRQKDTEQLHICIGYPGVQAGSEDTYALAIFNTLFGSAMSSRLFQRIREEKGMAYSVYSYPSAYINAGLFTLYAGTSPVHAQEVLTLLHGEVEEVIKNGVTQQEFGDAREQIKGSYILGLESASSRMSALGRRKLLLGSTQTEDEAIANINAVTIEAVNAIQRRLLQSACSIALVGNNADAVDVSMFAQ